jgi:NAD(P)-dependent dehydrogenase (short-subunit alcohol dehydrogenase family)
VIATVRDPSTAPELAALAAQHQNITVEKLDVGNRAEIIALAAKYQGKPIDVLLNNAGLLGDREKQGFKQLDYATFEEVLRVNTYAPLAMAQAFMPNVVASEQKKIVTLTSGLSSIANTKRSADLYFYRVSKAGVNMAMHALQSDVRDQGVKVGILAPGMVETRLLRQSGYAGAKNRDKMSSQERIANAQPRPVAIGQPERHHRAMQHAVFQKPILLARPFGNAIGIGRVDGVQLIHRQATRPAIEWAGRGMHHNRFRRRFTHHANQAHLRHCIDGDIGNGVLLPAHMAGLRRHIEQYINAFAQRMQFRVADIAAHQQNAGPFQIAGGSAAIGHHGVQRRDTRPHVGQGVTEVGAKKARPPGHQNPFPVPISWRYHACTS